MNIRNLAFVVALLIILTGPSAAADLAKAKAGRYDIDKSHAKIVFAIDHLGFSTYYGFFTDLEGNLQLNPAAPAKSGLTVTINIANIVTTDRMLDAKLKSDTFFDVAKYPKATFKSTSVEVTGDGTGKLTGDLTLHGVTKPVVLDVTFNGSGTPPMTQLYVVGFNATTTLKRSDFGITNFIPFVGDEVKLLISCEFDSTQQAH